MTSQISRREFVQASAGLVVSFYLPGRLVAGPAASPPAAPFAPNAWLRIGADGIVTLTIDRSEMGQGSQTGLALILAEEQIGRAHVCQSPMYLVCRLPTHHPSFPYTTLFRSQRGARSLLLSTWPPRCGPRRVPPSRPVRAQCLVAHRRRRDRHAHDRPVRDGPGLPDGARPDSGRRARGRLVHHTARAHAGESDRLVPHP